MWNNCEWVEDFFLRWKFLELGGRDGCTIFFQYAKNHYTVHIKMNVIVCELSQYYKKQKKIDEEQAIET